MARINITHSSHEGRVRLNLNGREHILSVPQGGKGEATVPDEFLPLLTDSNIDYEIVAPVAGNDEAEAGARGDSGAASAEADGPIPGSDPETLPPPGEPTPGVESAGFDASSNAAMPATPPNPSPSAPAGGADPAGKANAGKVAKPKVAPAGNDKSKPAKKASSKAK